MQVMPQRLRLLPAVLLALAEQGLSRFDMGAPFSIFAPAWGAAPARSGSGSNRDRIYGTRISFLT